MFAAYFIGEKTGTANPRRTRYLTPACVLMQALPDMDNVPWTSLDFQSQHSDLLYTGISAYVFNFIDTSCIAHNDLDTRKLSLASDLQVSRSPKLRAK
ncbi:MAG: hypothetical protein CL912_33260 [Deltaproteobacteria bacterium]|nr:hypothetical protein [Deltaproteobacteria bacterium]